MSVLGEKVLRITNNLTIPLSELRFRFARSSGPGGQHVNRSATRVELLFDVMGSPSLTEAQRERALKALAPYIDSDGVLHLVSAMRVPKRRRPTRPSRAAQERRLASKRRRSEIKRQRSPVRAED